MSLIQDLKNGIFDQHPLMQTSQILLLVQNLDPNRLEPGFQTACYRRLKQLGLQPLRKSKLDIETLQIREKINQGHFDQDLMKLRSNNVRIRLGLRDLGIPDDLNGEVHRRLRKLGVSSTIGASWKETFFDFETSESAYVLGWLASDGHVILDPIKARQKSFSLEISDQEILQEIALLLGLKKSSVIPRSDGRYTLSRSSDLACNSLKNVWGFTQQKSKNLLVKIPETHFWEFVRGFSDGDGSIILRPARPQRGEELIWTLNTHVNNREWLRKLNSMIQQRIGVLMSERTDSDMFRLYLGNVKAVEVLQMVYQNTEIPRLERKYQKFKGFVTQRLTSPKNNSVKRLLNPI